MDMNIFAMKYPDIFAFANAQVGLAGKLEVIRQPLYDRILYPTAGTAGTFTFFGTPQGNGQSTVSGLAAGAAKTLEDTNMTQNGQLPAPQAFWADGLEFTVDAGSVATANTYVTQVPTVFNLTAAATVQAGVNDQNAIYNAGVASLVIGQKPYFQLGPLDQFPPQSRKRADTSSGVAGTNAQPGIQGLQFMYIDGDARVLEPGLGIPTGMNFALNLSYFAAIATPSGFNARIQAQLKGWLFRAAQ